MSSSYIQTDSPVSKKGDDEFQRYPFAERISLLIKDYSKVDSLTIGVYGEWERGKLQF